MTQKSNVTKKVSIVTKPSGGIDQAAANRLAADGFAVIMKF